MAVLQKHSKMSFSIEELAKSSRDENWDQPTNFNNSAYVDHHKTNTPAKDNIFVLALPLAKPAHCQQVLQKRKRYDSSNSEDSSISSGSSAECSTSPNSSLDDSEINEQPTKRSRATFTTAQVTELELYYNTKRYLPVEDRPVIAKRLKLSQHQVKWWFQNRRMKEKRQLKTSNRHNFINMQQFVGVGEPGPRTPTQSGTQYSQYINYQQSAPHMYGMMTPYTYVPVSPVLYPSYAQQYYNAWSPQMAQQDLYH